MAYVDLTATEKAQLADFTRTYRAAIADTVRGLRRQQLLAMEYTSTISAIWAKVANGDLIPDETGLAGASQIMTKADFTAKFTWTTNVLAAIYSDNGGAVATVWPDRETVDSYAVQLAGATNIG